MNIKITDIAYHRNGVAGNGFHVVLFHDKANESDMVGIVFDEPGNVAILHLGLLADGDILLGSNSWRGDQYEPALRDAIARKESEY